MSYTDKKILLPVITGATATGKTACAVELSKMIDGEVVSADSMQIFSGMEILSASPTESEKQGIAHHLLGILAPEKPFSAAMYRDMAMPIIADIYNRRKQPILCGGTGLYIDAVTKHMRFSEEGDSELRQELHKIADEPNGRRKLHEMLYEIDPDSAKRLHENDVRRVIRAIEVYRVSGMTLTEQNRIDAETPGPYDEMVFALDIPRDVLYAKIDKRVEDMIGEGLIREVRALMKLGMEHPTAIQAIGYKEIAMALSGDIPLPVAVDIMKQASRNYAKRQITWLKRDKRTIWINACGKTSSEVAIEIHDRIVKHRNER